MKKKRERKLPDNLDVGKREQVKECDKIERKKCMVILMMTKENR